jgi:hypothetical protein
MISESLGERLGCRYMLDSIVDITLVRDPPIEFIAFIIAFYLNKLILERIFKILTQ